MKIFDPQHRKLTPEQANRYAMFEIAHTIVDFGAASFFVIGSVLFFFKPVETAAIVCFLIGSVLFAAKPSIRLAREIWLAKGNRIHQLAQLAPEGPGSLPEMNQVDGQPTDGGSGRTGRSVSGDDMTNLPEDGRGRSNF